MSEQIHVTAKTRLVDHKLSAQDIPAVIYGKKKPNIHVAFDEKSLSQLFYKTSFHTNIVKIHIDKEEITSLLKDYQLHPLNKSILHLDFLRVDAKSEVDVKVPIRLNGEDECPGVLEESGSIDQTFTAIDIKCQADQIPEAIFVDISALRLHDSIHFSDIVFPKGVSSSLEINEEHDPAILTIHPPTKEEIVEVVEEDLDAEMEEGDDVANEDASTEAQPETEDEKH
ncbi:MAG: 50S ribosomal protein L25 [Legionellales bacterium]|nr:50S ribosomal protein L25 [Legionellales bacterium]OUX66124.1 MAG: hypothetical protein CBE41_00670 [Gammaproteobacteria bacterium TMED281]|tara:strand:+ start:73 stop:753 length:681 start_codon:yes stop_codon:yes gene_type:complete